LNGAKSGDSVNKAVISDIAQNVSVPVQVGGGIRSLEVIEAYINSGVSRVIIGTAAITDKAFLQKSVETYGDKIAVSVDARDGYVATDGWTDTSDVKAIDLVKELETLGVSTIVYTDIAKDGMLQGPNLEEQEAIHQATRMDVIASGGVTTVDDVANLRELDMYGGIICKVLYDGKLDFRGVRVVKGKKFQNVQDVADPITLAKTYEKDGADELFILDITGEDRPTFLSIISQIREAISIPITVGGGIRRLSDAKETIEAG